MPTRQRPPAGVKKPERERRQLVRWDGDLDIQLLLTVQQACNATGIKIPWAQVAETMGEKFSEGAIIQHLSKLRVRRENDGKPVPPPLRRSVPASGSGPRNSAKKLTPKKEPVNAGKSADEFEELDDGSVATSEEDDPSWSQYGAKGRASVKRNKSHKSHKRQKVFVPTTPDQEDEYGSGLRTSDVGETTDDDSKVSIKNEQHIVSLPVGSGALQRLESSGSVAQPRSAEMTPDLTTGDTNSQPVFSSPTPNWGAPQQSPLGQYSGYRVASCPFPAAYTDPSYPQVLVSHPRQFYANQPGYPIRQPTPTGQNSVVSPQSIPSAVDPTLFDESNNPSWMSEGTFSHLNALEGQSTDTDLHWDGTLTSIENSTWGLQVHGLAQSTEFEGKEC